MFYTAYIYANGKPYSNLPITRNTLEELFQELYAQTRKILSETPNATVTFRTHIGFIMG